ncbi:hypothetical protein NPIL_394991 [Nephila pilipes]|uniref:Uncharacterized protein n=1 Tax=Nephila pilipes TaxID=299642 RepID=A0A8X6NBE4_NEPPI|nr:hypothetical protein NPIL_394991 [Nephila pilipes]
MVLNSAIELVSCSHPSNNQESDTKSLLVEKPLQRMISYREVILGLGKEFFSFEDKRETVLCEKKLLLLLNIRHGLSGVISLPE